VRSVGRRVSTLAVVVTALAPIFLGQTEPRIESVDLDQLLTRVSERVQQYYTNLLSISWTDKVRQEVLKEDLEQKEKPRELVYDMIIRHQEARSTEDIAPFYVREVANLTLADGKRVSKGESAKSTDPRFASMGSLAFLMARTRDRLQFTFAGSSELAGRKVLMIDVTNPQRTPPRVDWNTSFRLLGVNHSFQISGVQYNTGRIWVDPESFDVLQLEWKSDPFDFQHPGRKEKLRHEMGMTARFKRVSFENPDQTFVVPDSEEWFRNIKGGQRFPVVRVFHSFTNYKRFLGDTKIVVVEETK
jgi:hypothetical protein